MPTPHNSAKKGEIAKFVLMPGDPLRAKFIADKFLKNVKQFNTVRNMFGYTGTYKGVKVSVMGSGMGMPSIGIYAFELFKFYDVDTIIRVGSCGSFQKEIKVYDVILAQGSSTDSNFADQYSLKKGTFSALSSFELLDKAYQIAKAKKIKTHVGNILSSDVFYGHDQEMWKKWAGLNVLAVEMESYALFTLAAAFKKKALTILTVSDSLVTHQETSAQERETKFLQMMEIALELSQK
jgi:purine-nucleoside phosphorylase